MPRQLAEQTILGFVGSLLGGCRFANGLLARRFLRSRFGISVVSGTRPFSLDGLDAGNQSPLLAQFARCIESFCLSLDSQPKKAIGCFIQRQLKLLGAHYSQQITFKDHSLIHI